MKNSKKSLKDLVTKRLKSNYRFEFTGNEIQKKLVLSWFITTKRLKCREKTFALLFNETIGINGLIKYYGQSNELPFIFYALINSNIIKKHDRFKAVLRHWFIKRNGKPFTQEDFDTAYNRCLGIKITNEIDNLIRQVIRIQ